ncbi:DUF4921 family protein [Actinotalea subterranea]|uniref:DUF4921 family protein n=1 Tax=Actinotalea subterranea TaxID=2607497 RepID=UPI0011EFBD28|nr:DUF4921 family protein [Actinotalea subterranea]
MTAGIRAGPVPDPQEPLVRLPDGTVKQVSPLTGTVVWTVPGRAGRPFSTPSGERRAIDPDRRDALCAFCPARYLETPPEKARLVRLPDGRWETLRDVQARDLDATVADVRRVPNLFEILSVGYWRANHHHEAPVEACERAARYLADPAGRAHALAVVERRLRAGGMSDARWAAIGQDARLAHAADLFAGTHDVVVARRHVVDGARYEDELAGAGTLTPDEHARYLAFTVDAMPSLYSAQPHARYVAAFQNWLRPAGASFDHLHKQLVAIDEHGPRLEEVLARTRRDPGLLGRVLAHAQAHGLVVAQDEHAVAVAGVGHRYPSLEVYSTSTHHRPWEHTPAEVRGFSDVLHALHAATGPAVPTNEEWHHRPVNVDDPLPWHVVLKWRVSTLAGFEGSTKINVNTLDPVGLRDRVVAELLRLREAGLVAPLRVGDECAVGPGTLRYRG